MTAVDGLPADGQTVDVIPASFLLRFDEDLSPASVALASAFDLRAAGSDGFFDTPDDVVYNLTNQPTYVHGREVHLGISDGALVAGQYRLMVEAVITDLVGNTLDGNGDLTGGDPFTRQFTVTPRAEFPFVFEGSSNDARTDAEAIPLMEDTNGAGYHRGVGLGSLDPSSDNDWWGFEAQGADRVAVWVETPGNGLDTYLELYDAAGSRVTYDHDNGGPDADDYISGYLVPSDGTYSVRIWRRGGSSTGTYEVRVDLARGMDLETDHNYANDSTGGADAMTLVGEGSGTGLCFDGSNDQVQVGDTASLDLSGALTFEAWVCPVNPGSDEPVLAKEGPGGKQAYWFGVFGNQFGLLLNDGRNGWALDARHSGSISYGQWQRIASTWDGTTWRNYRDGELVGEGSWSGTLPDSPAPLTLGSNSDYNSTKFAGGMDEVRIWGTARTQTEIQESMDRRLTGVEAGLVSYWEFDEGTGQAVADSGPGGNDGQLGTTSSQDTSDPAWLAHGAPLLGDSTQRTGTVAGVIMAGQSGNVDEDYFNLGTVEAGETILLTMRLPTTSGLTPLVEIRNANGQPVEISVRPSDAVARADVAETGTFYAVVVATSGQGNEGRYLLDAAIQPTSELNFADLVVTDIAAPPSVASGETVPIGWTVGNFGAVDIVGATWSDRIVLSRNDRYGDGDDIQLGVFSQMGDLAVGITYTESAQITMPLEISGDYWVFVKTDFANGVAEFIFEDNNVAQDDGILSATLTPYGDLEASGVTSGTLGVVGETATIDWLVTNVGPGTTGNGTPGGDVSSWVDRIVFSVDAVYGGGDDVAIADVARGSALGSGGSYPGTWTGVLPGGLSGEYHVIVKTDADNAVYEYDDAGSNVAVGASTILVAPQPYADLNVLNVEVVRDSAPSGRAIDVSWTVRNDGIAAATGSWTDRIVLSDDGMLEPSDTQLSLVVHNGDVGVGRQNVSVVLPLDVGMPEGDYYLLVTTDAYGQQPEGDEGNNVAASAAIHLTFPPMPDLGIDGLTVAEASLESGGRMTVQWNVANGGTGETNNATSITKTSSLSPYPDLAVSTVAAAVADALPGQSVEVTWLLVNEGNEAAAGPWTEQIFLSSDSSVGGDQWLATVSFEGAIGVGGSVPRSRMITLPTFLLGNYWFVVRTDVGGSVFELDEADNIAISAAPTLRVHVNPNPVTEGAGPSGAGLTISRNTLPTAALTVSILRDDPLQAAIQPTVVMGIGESSVLVPVNVLDNSYVDGERTLTITATASGYVSSGEGLLINDDDIPQLTLTIDTTAISEGDGLFAATGTITRDTVSLNALEVLLRRSTGDVSVPPVVYIAAGETSVTFPIHATDNGLVDGDRDVTITAYNSDILRSRPLEEGKDSESLIVTDDDGPTLSVQISGMLSESGTLTGTVRRNTPPVGDLEVSLASSDTSEVTVLPTVTIPDGSVTVAFVMTGVEDGEVDGLQTATITASRAGYSSGAATVNVSDVDLPDLLVAELIAPDTAKTGEFINVSWTIANDGLAPASGIWWDRVYLSTDRYYGATRWRGSSFRTGRPTRWTWARATAARHLSACRRTWGTCTSSL